MTTIGGYGQKHTDNKQQIYFSSAEVEEKDDDSESGEVSEIEASSSTFQKAWEDVTTSRTWRHSIGRVSCLVRTPIYALGIVALLAKDFLIKLPIALVEMDLENKDDTFKLDFAKNQAALANISTSQACQSSLASNGISR